MDCGQETSTMLIKTDGDTPRAPLLSPVPCFQDDAIADYLSRDYHRAADDVACIHQDTSTKFTEICSVEKHECTSPSNSISEEASSTLQASPSAGCPETHVNQNHPEFHPEEGQVSPAKVYTELLSPVSNEDAPQATLSREPSAAQVQEPTETTMFSPQGPTVHSPTGPTLDSQAGSTLHSQTGSTIHSQTGSTLHSSTGSTLHSGSTLTLGFYKDLLSNSPVAGNRTPAVSESLTNTEAVENVRDDQAGHSPLDGSHSRTMEASPTTGNNIVPSSVTDNDIAPSPTTGNSMVPSPATENQLQPSTRSHLAEGEGHIKAAHRLLVQNRQSFTPLLTASEKGFLQPRNSSFFASTPSPDETKAPIVYTPMVHSASYDLQPQPSPVGSTVHSPSSSLAKRTRISYTTTQLGRMESVFLTTAYPDNVLYTNLEEELDVPQKNLKTWFQNKRARNKKQKSLEANQTPKVSSAPTQRLNGIAAPPTASSAHPRNSYLSTSGPPLRPQVDLPMMTRPASCSFPTSQPQFLYHSLPVYPRHMQPPAVSPYGACAMGPWDSKHPSYSAPFRHNPMQRFWTPPLLQQPQTPKYPIYRKNESSSQYPPAVKPSNQKFNFITSPRMHPGSSQGNGSLVENVDSIFISPEHRSTLQALEKLCSSMPFDGSCDSHFFR